MGKVWVVVGSQWGDEGKGKIIDILARDMDCIVRYQGGNNAGHTVIIDDQEFILHLIPSGVLHKGKQCVIGNGVVIDPEALFSEMEMLTKRGIDVDSNIKISYQSHIIFPYHKILDHVKEKYSGREKIGTTGRGIGPCYTDKIARCGIRAIDIVNEGVLYQKLKFNINEKNQVLQKIYNEPLLKFEEIFEKYLTYGRKIKKYLCDVTYLLSEAVANGKNILFEGAQGTFLDIDFGTYPFVTSSNSSAGGACTGSGIGPTKIDKVIGVAKAYTTRVGEGPFPTEFTEDMMAKVRSRGKEFGATTGRPRRCGWFDAVIVRYSALVNGLDSIAITKLDVLDTQENIRICTGYRYNGKVYEEYPSDIEILQNCQPLYEDHSGWQEDTTHITSYDELPLNARKYLRRLSELVKTPIAIITVGPERGQTIVSTGK